MTAGAWAAKRTVNIAVGARALIGLACGYTIKGENAYSASAFVMALFGAFVSGMFIRWSRCTALRLPTSRPSRP